MTTQTFVNDQGTTVTPEQKLGQIPAKWSGNVDIQGVIEQDGHVEPSGEPQFFGVYWVLEDGMSLWMEDFIDEAAARQFGEQVKTAAMMNIPARH